MFPKLNAGGMTCFVFNSYQSGNFTLLPYVTDHKELRIVSLHVHFLRTSAFLKSFSGLKCTRDLFHERSLMRAFKPCAPSATSQKISKDSSKMANHPFGHNLNIIGIKGHDHEHVGLGLDTNRRYVLHAHRFWWHDNIFCVKNY